MEGEVAIPQMKEVMGECRPERSQDHILSRLNEPCLGIVVGLLWEEGYELCYARTTGGILSYSILSNFYLIMSAPRS